MNHNKILIGGTYRVRFAPGVQARAEVLRAVPPEEQDRPVLGERLQIVYECRLMHSVGQYKKGFVFQVRSRSIFELVEDPPGGRKETFLTPNDQRHRLGLTKAQAEAPPETVQQETPTPSPTLNMNQPNFIDMAKAMALKGTAAQQAVNEVLAPPKPQQVPASQQTVTVALRLQVALGDVPSLLDALSQYEPKLDMVRPNDYE